MSAKMKFLIHNRKDNFMLIKGKIISSKKYFSDLNNGEEFQIKVSMLDGKIKLLDTFGFEDCTISNVKILPAPFNYYARRNCETYYTIDKALPKEEYTQTIYWTRKQWCGYGETEDITEFRDITRKRYHRDFHSPFSVEFTLIISNEETYIISDTIKYLDNDMNKIFNTINMVLGLFGECEIISKNSISSIPYKCLNWELLPKGNRPWNEVYQVIKDICKKSKNTQKQMMLNNCGYIYNKNPDFIAYGKAGFKGYIVFGFIKKNIYILESNVPNNATYVLNNNWEKISKLTKAEILTSNLHKCRIIHNSKWNNNFEKIFNDL